MLEGLLSNVLESTVASVFASLLLVAVSMAKKNAGPSVRWTLVPPIVVSGRGLQVKYSRTPVDNLVEFTCILRYTSLMHNDSLQEGQFSWKVPGNAVSTEILSERRCERLRLCCDGDRIVVSFDKLMVGAAAIVRVLCQLEYRSYGTIEESSDGLSIVGPSVIRVPRWAGLVSVVRAVILVPILYNYAYVGLGYSEVLAWLIMLLFPVSFVAFFFVRYSAMFWLEYWLVFRKKIPPMDLLRRWS